MFKITDFTLKFKDYLNLGQRLQIAAEYFSSFEPYGIVSRLANEYRTSRHQVYSIIYRVTHAFAPQSPGPSPDPVSKLKGENLLLKQEISRLQHQVEVLESRLANSVEVTKERLRRTILTQAVGLSSHRQIHRVLVEAFGHKHALSPTKIQQTLAHYGTVAGLILMDNKVRQKVHIGAADEIFFHQTPIGCLVDMDSGVIAALERMKDRSGKSWKKIFSAFPNLELVVRDMGKGLRCGITLTSETLKQMGDYWHLLYKRIAPATKNLEKWANDILNEEEQTINLWAEGLKDWASVVKIQQTCEAMLDMMEAYYQAIETVMAAFQSITPQYSIATKESFNGLWEKAIEWLKHVDREPAKRLQKFLADRQSEYQTCWEFIQAQLQPLSVEMPQNFGITNKELLQMVIEEICLRRKAYQEKTTEAYQEYSSFWKRVGSKVQKVLKPFSQIWQKVQRLLYHPPRASSLVESFNSLLRAAQQLKRNVSQEFLYLMALAFNMTPHNGKPSPFDRAGIDFGTKDWLTLVETYQLA